jgi:hypothetical protein
MCFVGFYTRYWYISTFISRRYGYAERAVSPAGHASSSLSSPAVVTTRPTTHIISINHLTNYDQDQQRHCVTSIRPNHYPRRHRVKRDITAVRAGVAGGGVDLGSRAAPRRPQPDAAPGGDARAGTWISDRLNPPGNSVLGGSFAAPQPAPPKAALLASTAQRWRGDGVGGGEGGSEGPSGRWSRRGGGVSF